MVGAVNRLYEHCLVAHGEADSATVMERPAVLHPHSCADGAGGLTAEVGGAFIFYQDGCGAADGGSSYQRWQNTRVSIQRKWLNKRNRCTQTNRKHTQKNVIMVKLDLDFQNIPMSPHLDLFSLFFCQ